MKITLLLFKLILFLNTPSVYGNSAVYNQYRTCLAAAKEIGTAYGNVEQLENLFVIPHPLNSSKYYFITDKGISISDFSKDPVMTDRKNSVAGKKLERHFFLQLPNEDRYIFVGFQNYDGRGNFMTLAPSNGKTESDCHKDKNCNTLKPLSQYNADIKLVIETEISKRIVDAKRKTSSILNTAPFSKDPIKPLNERELAQEQFIKMKIQCEKIPGFENIETWNDDARAALKPLIKSVN